MLQQSLANRTKQQTGKATATARTNNHKIMIQTSLSQSFNSRTRHNSSMNLQIRQTLQNWLHSLLKILHVRSHNSGVSLSTLHSWNCGNNIKLSMPAIRQISRNFKSFKPPLRLVRANSHTRNRIIQVNTLTVIVSVRHNHNWAIRISWKRRTSCAEQTLCQATLTTITNHNKLIVTRKLHENRRRIACNN